jgi:membrane associated rhomboid family serine protease
MPLSDNLVLIAVTCVISWWGFGHRAFLDRWLLNPYQTSRQKRLLPYLSYGFVHADGTHLIFNMITLYFFGREMEGFYGGYFHGLGYYLFYLSGIMISVLPSALPNRGNPRYATLGASGAVSGVLMAYVLLKPWSLIYIYFVPVPAVLYALFYLGYSYWMDRKGGDNVNHSAHLWGGVYGLIVTVLLEPDALNGFFVQFRNL